MKRHWLRLFLQSAIPSPESDHNHGDRERRGPLAGVVVTDIGTESPTQGLLQSNDVIEEVDRKPVRSAQEYEDIVSKIGKHDTVLLLIYRDGGSAYLTIQP